MRGERDPNISFILCSWQCCYVVCCMLYVVCCMLYLAHWSPCWCWLSNGSIRLFKHRLALFCCSAIIPLIPSHYIPLYCYLSAWCFFFSTFTNGVFWHNTEIIFAPEVWFIYNQKSAVERKLMTQIFCPQLGSLKVQLFLLILNKQCRLGHMMTR